MELWLESCIVVLAVLVLLLCIRLHLAKKVALEIHAALPEKLNTDTNTPITLSCRDKDLCFLADTLNQSLEQLRAMQHCFKQGNAQLQTSITSIFHDLRTPLTAICGNLELLEKEPLSTVSRQYVAIIRERTKVMTQLTEELFRYSVVLSVPLAQPLQEVSVKRNFRGKHCRNVCGAQKTPDHAGHYHNRPYRAAHARSVRLIARLFQPVKQCRKIQ